MRSILRDADPLELIGLAAQLAALWLLGYGLILGIAALTGISP